MAWGPFSAEAVELNTTLHRLHKEGRISAALDTIKEALSRAHSVGPSNVSYEEFEAACEVAAK